MDPETLRRAFANRFGGRPALVARSPGRVNLIGEHTDYNAGLVLPMAIDREIRVAARGRPDRRVIVVSLDFEAPAVFDLGELSSMQAARSRAARPEQLPEQRLEQLPDQRPDQRVESGPGWADYVAGVAWSLGEAGCALRGFEAVVASDLPLDAGLSSSAALEMAVAHVFAVLGGYPWEPVAMAQLMRRAENEWMGVACGVMDQLAVGCGVQDHALLIDCRSLAIEPVPLPPAVAVVVLDTGVRRRLADTEYNLRRRECDEAAHLLGLDALRDLDLEWLVQKRGGLPERLYRRALHVLTENGRVLDVARALPAGDLSTCGRALCESHSSLAEQFGVSCPELNAMVRCATDQTGCHGARMTGAGFGGCVVALAALGEAERCRANALAAYRAETGREARGWICRAAHGTSCVVEQPARP